MKQVEEVLNSVKQEYETLEVPGELEGRLRRALADRRPAASRRNSWIFKAAAVLLIVVLLGYNSDTLAYYGKKLVGYDSVMTGTLKHLNDLGKGQKIGKSYTFKNGIKIVLDGIMLDDNQLVAFYTVKDPKGKGDQISLSPILTMKGLFGEYMMHSGYGDMNKTGTEIKWATTFKSPFFLERKLSFRIGIHTSGYSEDGEISFVLDRSKAMGHTLRKNINKSLEVDETKIHFESISASPTTTIVNGSLENIIALAIDQMRGERFRPNGLVIKLFADGREIPGRGGGMSTDMKGIRFKNEYEPLPSGIKSLQLKLVSFGADHDINKKFNLNKDKENQDINMLGQRVTVNRIYEAEGNTCVTISSENSIVLTRVYMIMDDKVVPLEKTIPGNETKNTDGTITHTRTMVFPGTGKALKLDVKRMKYDKVYNKSLDIPVD